MYKPKFGHLPEENQIRTNPTEAARAPHLVRHVLCIHEREARFVPIRVWQKEIRSARNIDAKDGHSVLKRRVSGGTKLATTRRDGGQRRKPTCATERRRTKMAATMNTKPQNAELIKAALAAKATKVESKDKVTFTNVDLVVKDQKLVLAIDLNKFAMKGTEFAMSKAYIDEKGNAKGNNPMLATLNEKLAEPLYIGVLDGKYKVRINLNVMLLG